MGIANTTALRLAISLLTLSVVFVAMLGIWLVTVRTDPVVLTGATDPKELLLEAQLKGALVEATSMTKNTSSSCKSFLVVRPVGRPRNVSKLDLVATRTVRAKGTVVGSPIAI